MNGWFVFSVVTCIVLGCGVVLTVVLLKAAWAQKEREVLSSDDLRVLEESAMLLIEQLKAETDARISTLADHASRLEGLVREADLRIAALQKPREPQMTVPRGSLTRNAAPTGDTGMDSAEAARTLGLDCAEVKLIQRLARSAERQASGAPAWGGTA